MNYSKCLIEYITELEKTDLQQTTRLDMQSLRDDCPGNVNIITTEGNIQALEYAVVRRI